MYSIPFPGTAIINSYFIIFPSQNLPQHKKSKMNEVTRGKDADSDADVEKTTNHFCDLCKLEYVSEEVCVIFDFLGFIIISV